MCLKRLNQNVLILCENIAAESYSLVLQITSEVFDKTQRTVKNPGLLYFLINKTILTLY